MGSLNLINGLQLSDTKIIENDNGNILRILRNDDIGFYGFGEAYISTIKYNSIKAWKKHHLMTSNLIVPIGLIKVVVYDDRVNSPTQNLINEFIIGPSNYKRITIPPNLYYGFAGLSKNLNHLVNISNITHDINEQESINILDFKIQYNNWLNK